MHAKTSPLGWHMNDTSVTPWVEWALRGLLTALLGFAVAYLRDSSRELTAMNVSLVRIELENRRTADKLEEMGREFSSRIDSLQNRVQTLERNAPPQK